MDINKILSADLLDLVFDSRNKDYGAYDLRRTYNHRIRKALIITGSFVLVGLTSAVLANKLKPRDHGELLTRVVTISDLNVDKPEEKLPPPPKQAEPPKTRTEQVTPPVITPDKDVSEPPPTQDDIHDAKIDVVKTDGLVDDGIQTPQALDDGKNIIEENTHKPDEPFTIVQVEASFLGNWQKFLLRNLDPQVPANNGAPAGDYTIIVQFVVDVDGSVSDITPLTNAGYGMEEEAVRVLRKATKWEPAFQNGQHVKAYRKQKIIFQVSDNG